jgi:hypothetical protein
MSATPPFSPHRGLADLACPALLKILDPPIKGCKVEQTNERRRSRSF